MLSHQPCTLPGLSSKAKSVDCTDSAQLVKCWAEDDRFQSDEHAVGWHKITLFTSLPGGSVPAPRRCWGDAMRTTGDEVSSVLLQM